MISIPMPSTRQLAAIMFTDIVGYTALMQQDESRAVTVIKHYNSTLDKCVTKYHGRVVNYYGDGSLCIFQSATDAVNCSIEIQEELRKEPVIPLRIGLHIGEVFFENEKALGDGVNVASRVQSLGQGNSILVSGEIHDKIKNNPLISTLSLGYFDFKNVNKPLEVFAIANPGLSVPKRKNISGKLKKKNRAKQWLIGGSVVLGIVALGLLFFRNSFSNKDKESQNSIAVLPFVDRSVNKDQEYFSDGLSEQLLNLLSKVPELKVIGRTSSFSFKGKNEDLAVIGEKLGVAHILEGSVQKDGNKIRVTTQLVRIKDGVHLWSEKYDRDIKSLFDLQDEIASTVVKQLKLKLFAGSAATASTSNIEVHNLILQGNYFFDKLDEQNVSKALSLYQQALAIDSMDARVWVAIGKTYSRQAWQNYIEQFRGYELARQAALKAISLDSNLAEAHIQLAGIKMYHDFDWDGADHGFQKAQSLEPGNANLLNNLGVLAQIRGDWNEAIRFVGQALELDPLRPIFYSNQGANLTYAGRIAEAEKYYRKIIELNPQFQRAHLYLGRCYLLQGKPEAALKEMVQEAIPVFKEFGLALAYHAIGKRVEADRALSSFLEKYQHEWQYLLAEIYAFRGEKDLAFDWLNKAYMVKDSWLVWVKGDPLLKNLYNDPRYNNFLKKMNLD